MTNKIDYDLNIYHLDTGETIVDDRGYNVPVYDDQWYVDIYEHLNGSQHHVVGPFKITKRQEALLQLGTGGYFDEDDNWYGMWGFLEDYQDRLEWELENILRSLPEYKEEVLF